MKKTLSLPEEIIEDIKLLCRYRGQTFSGLVRILLERELEKSKGELKEARLYNKSHLYRMFGGL